MESAEAAGILHKGNKDETLLAFIDGKEVPIVQEPDMYQASKGTWTPVGVTFVNKGIKYCAVTGTVYDDKRSCHRRYEPDKEMEKWVVRVHAAKVMEEGTLQVRKHGRVVSITQDPHWTSLSLTEGATGLPTETRQKLSRNAVQDATSSASKNRGYKQRPSSQSAVK